MGWVENATPEVEAISQWKTIIAVCVVVSTVAAVVVSLRLWVRYRNHGLQSDDYLSALSMAFAITYAALCIARMLLTCHDPSNHTLMSDQKQNTAWVYHWHSVQKKI